MNNIFNSANESLESMSAPGRPAFSLPTNTVQCECGALLTGEDNFCKYCGNSHDKALNKIDLTKVQQAVPSPDFYECSKCGYGFEASELGYRIAHYCPKCGTDMKDF